MIFHKPINKDTKVADLIFANSSIMWLLQYFGEGLLVRDLTVEGWCKRSNIPQEVFVAFVNLYNGHENIDLGSIDETHVSTIIFFLKNTHTVYREQHYPEIKRLIAMMFEKNPDPAVEMLLPFFDEYFTEVMTHLSYEDSVVFPYISDLTSANQIPDSLFSAKEYKDHHSDIEFKLLELRSLLIKNIPENNDLQARQKLIAKLAELEIDLHIHSRIEDHVLIPLIEKLESTKK